MKGLFFSDEYRDEPFDREYHPGEPLARWNPPWENKGWQASMAVIEKLPHPLGKMKEPSGGHIWLD